jgi:hypothetical protein
MDKPQRRKREKSKKLVQLELSKPIQLSLFELAPDEDDYSQSVELYDFIPKYFWGKADRLNGKFLDNLQREFECRGRRYQLTLMPARLELKEGGFKEFYPARREELVEDALRKLMTERQSVMLDGEAGIVFTLYQLQQELADKGHTYSYDELKDAIRVLNNTDIVLKDDNEQIETAFSPIESYGFAEEGGETTTFVRFSPLVTHSIKAGTYRLINYDTAMSYKLVIARQLHKRMSHHYIQASMTNPYEILLTTIIRDFGLTPQKRVQQNLTEVEKAITEMKDKNVIINCHINKIFQEKPRAKLIDVKFSFQPHPFFINDIKKANAKAKKRRELTDGNPPNT